MAFAYTRKISVAFLTWIVGATLWSLAQTTASKSHPANLRSVPNGNYLVILEMDGQVKRLNFKIEGDRAKCVNSSDPSLKDIQGQFQSRGNQLLWDSSKAQLFAAHNYGSFV